MTDEETAARAERVERSHDDEHAHSVYARNVAEQRLRRRTWVEKLLMGLLALVIAAALVGSAVSIVNDRAQQINNDRADCRGKAIGLTLYWSLSALAAPAVPPGQTREEFAKTERGKAVANGRKSAQPLIDPDHYCQ